MRLINADTLFEYIRFDREAAKVHPQEMCERLDRFCDYAEALVKEAPTIDAEPVRHGRWIPNIRVHYKAYPPYEYQSGYKCTLCDRVARTNKEPYCHCGAKMDLEVQDDG